MIIEPEDEEFNRIERESRIRQEYIKAMNEKTVQSMSVSADDYLKLSDELAVAQMLIRDLNDRLAKFNKEKLGQDVQPEPPKYSFKAHWEKDGRIGVVAAVVRPDGGMHLLQNIIDPPQRTWVRLTDKEIEECWDGDLSPYQMQCIREIEAKLKEKNT
jgi:hypothetical protein